MATTSSLASHKEHLVYLKKKLERTKDEESILRIIHKLSKIPITIELLQGTGAGKIMRGMAKKPGSVGLKASSLLNKWRDIVAHSQKSSEISSLKENDHPKTMLHHTSSKHQKSERENKKHSEEEKHYKNKHSKKEKHSTHKEKYFEDTNRHSEQSKEKLKLDLKEEKHCKEKQLLKRKLLCEEFELESKKKHVKEKETKLEYSKHSIKHNGESSSSNEKGEKISSKKHSNFLPQILNTEDNEFESEHLFLEHELTASNGYESAHNSDSSASCEKSDSYNHRSQTLSPNLKDSFKKSKKKLEKGGELGITKSDKKKDKIISKKSSKKDLKMLSTEEFTSSEALFEDCLNFNDIVVNVKKKKSTKPLSSPLSKKIKEPSKSFENTNKLKKDTDLSPISIEKEKKYSKERLPEEVTQSYELLDKGFDIASTLPQTQPNYRPLPQRNYDYSPLIKKEKMSDEDAIKFTSSRKEKTAVYSGRKNKNNYLTAVPSLFECCTRVLIENIDDIEYMGEIPFFLLESMLQRCTPSQLYRIEDFNPYLLEDTNDLWAAHCKRDFRSAKPEENETWRELYWRSHDEREQRLKSVTANISALIANSNPTRKAKLAYVDSVVKPPRDVARRQAKHGTALPTNHTMKAGPPSKASPRPTAPSINSANSTASTSRPRVEVKPIKPKVAPLMAKTLKSMKKCFRR